MFLKTSGLGWAEQGIYLPLPAEHQLPHGSLWRDVAVTGWLDAFINDTQSVQHKAGYNECVQWVEKERIMKNRTTHGVAAEPAGKSEAIGH